MSRLIQRQCPQCNNAFQARRKNQFYCSTECRTDANNEKAKARYAAFKEDAPKASAVQDELKKLKARMASLMIIIQGVQEIDEKTIMYRKRIYKRTTRLTKLDIGVMLQPGGAIRVADNKIYYRQQHHTSVDWEYMLTK